MLSDDDEYTLVMEVRASHDPALRGILNEARRVPYYALCLAVATAVVAVIVAAYLAYAYSQKKGTTVIKTVIETVIKTVDPRFMMSRRLRSGGGALTHPPPQPPPAPTMDEGLIDFNDVDLLSEIEVGLAEEDATPLWTPVRTQLRAPVSRIPSPPASSAPDSAPASEHSCGFSDTSSEPMQMQQTDSKSGRVRVRPTTVEHDKDWNKSVRVTRVK